MTKPATLCEKFAYLNVRQEQSYEVSDEDRLATVEEESSESIEPPSSPPPMHRSWDSFFPNSNAKKVSVSRQKLFKRLMDEYCELQDRVATLENKNWQLEQSMNELHFIVTRCFFVPPPNFQSHTPNPYSFPTQPTSYPHYSYPPRSTPHYPQYPFPEQSASPPRPISPTAFHYPQHPFPESSNSSYSRRPTYSSSHYPQHPFPEQYDSPPRSTSPTAFSNPQSSPPFFTPPSRNFSADFSPHPNGAPQNFPIEEPPIDFWEYKIKEHFDNEAYNLCAHFIEITLSYDPSNAVALDYRSSIEQMRSDEPVSTTEQ